MDIVAALILAPFMMIAAAYIQAIVIFAVLFPFCLAFVLIKEKIFGVTRPRSLLAQEQE